MNKLPLYVALDLNEEKKALLVARETSPYIEGFKIGPQLYLKSGPSLISKLSPYGKIFLDFKFFDISSTMISAVQSAFDLGVDMLTVHALAGEESLNRLAELQTKLNRKRDFRILAVTILTSFSQENLPPSLQTHSLLSHVESLSDLVIRSGLNSLVCSGNEAAGLRKKHPKAYLLTPGIRFAEKDSYDTPFLSRPVNTKEDQKRIFTPQKALSAGVNTLVIGRPIYESTNPAEVCVWLQKKLSSFL